MIPDLSVDGLQNGHRVRHGVDEPVDGKLVHDLAVGRRRDPSYKSCRLSVFTPLVEEHDPLKRQSWTHVGYGEGLEAFVQCVDLSHVVVFVPDEVVREW